MIGLAIAVVWSIAAVWQRHRWARGGLAVATVVALTAHDALANCYRSLGRFAEAQWHFSALRGMDQGAGE